MMQATEKQCIPQLESAMLEKNIGNQNTTWEMKGSKKGSLGRHTSSLRLGGKKEIQTKIWDKVANAKDRQVRPTTQTGALGVDNMSGHPTGCKRLSYNKHFKLWAPEPRLYLVILTMRDNIKIYSKKIILPQGENNSGSSAL